MRALAELIDVDDPAWAYADELIAGSVVPVEVLAPDRAQCAASLHQLQVSTRSALGSVALNTGGMLVDHGWLRVYGGSGTAGGMPGLAEVNDFPAEPSPSGVPRGRAPPAAGAERHPVPVVRAGAPRPRSHQPPACGDAGAAQPAP